MGQKQSYDHQPLLTRHGVAYFALMELLDEKEKILTLPEEIQREIKLKGKVDNIKNLDLDKVPNKKLSAFIITEKGFQLLVDFIMPEIILPSEIWQHIIDFLAEDDVFSAGRCQFINKHIQSIVLNAFAWRRVYEDWTKTKPEPNGTQWYTRFVNEALWTRKIEFPADTISRYDEGYYCEVKAIEFTSSVITVHIHEHGNMTAGTIQDPTSSSLLTVVGSFAPIKSRLVTSKFSIADPTKEYLGTLSYQASYGIGCTYSFQYGSFGYGPALLFTLDEAFIKNNKLQHIIDRWTNGFTGSLASSS